MDRLIFFLRGKMWGVGLSPDCISWIEHPAAYYFFHYLFIYFTIVFSTFTLYFSLSGVFAFVGNCRVFMDFIAIKHLLHLNVISKKMLLCHKKWRVHYTKVFLFYFILFLLIYILERIYLLIIFWRVTKLPSDWLKAFKFSPNWFWLAEKMALKVLSIRNVTWIIIFLRAFCDLHFYEMYLEI